MTNQMFGGNLAGNSTTFGRRKVIPRVCVVDAKRHLRAFLTDILEDLGFVTSECAKDEDLGAILKTHLPDLIPDCHHRCIQREVWRVVGAHIDPELTIEPIQRLRPESALNGGNVVEPHLADLG